MHHLVIHVQFDVKPEHLARFNELIAVNAHASVREEPGCFQFDVACDQADPCKVVLYEVYRDAAAFDDHLQRPHTRLFLEQARPLVERQVITRMTRTVAPPVKPAPPTPGSAPSNS